MSGLDFHQTEETVFCLETDEEKEYSPISCSGIDLSE